MSFSIVYSKESDNQSYFTVACLCIQTENTIPGLNVFSNRDRAEGGIQKWLMIKNNRHFTAVANKMTEVSQLS